MGQVAIRHYANLREPSFNLRFKLYSKQQTLPLPLQLDPSVSTFSPLEQQVKSNIRYTGKGFIPCDG